MHKGINEISSSEEKKWDGLEEEARNLLKTINGVYFGEYLEIISDIKKLFVLNFLLGLTRGVGMALGFTILGTIVFHILKKIIILNLPGISSFIAEIVRLVQLKNQFP
ncbi:MAG TPA: hypothetical protein DEA47_01770 [Peptococcaceae bacterium]|nr:MAG: Uncharacterized protein XD50_1489 [Clostridia bacterium 41_269]HBT20086.1 hypothetical protein [Peptococcaceae bacterium]